MEQCKSRTTISQTTAPLPFGNSDTQGTFLHISIKCLSDLEFTSDERMTFQPSQKYLSQGGLQFP